MLVYLKGIASDLFYGARLPPTLKAFEYSSLNFKLNIQRINNKIK